jgi:hypothetical protein
MCTGSSCIMTLSPYPTMPIPMPIPRNPNIRRPLRWRYYLCLICRRLCADINSAPIASIGVFYDHSTSRKQDEAQSKTIDNFGHRNFLAKNFSVRQNPIINFATKSSAVREFYQ